MSNIVPFEQQMTLATAFAKSQLFGVKTPDQALALMALCEAEGLHPATAVRDYHIISGKPALKADAMLARFQKAGGRVEWKEYTDKRCAAVISHPQGGSVEVVWTVEMAKTAGLDRNPTWKSYPRQMLRSRVISEGIRTVYPGVASGVYTVEEVSDFEPLPQRQHRPAQVIVEQADATDHLIAAAQDAAERGTEVYKAHWQSMPLEHRKALQSRHEEFKQAAADADARIIESNAEQVANDFLGADE